MYRISIEKDNDKMILFLDSMTFIPGIGPDSDMDGHDLSGLTYSETLRAEEFVERFNEYCADKAKLIRYMGMPVIIVKDFYPKELDLEDDGEEEDTDIDFEEAGPALKLSWQQLFDMTEEESEEYLQKYKQLIYKK